MNPPLDPIEVRVLGALMEKDVTTPEYYPLTLNALVAACNQKSNREPTVSYDEQTVQEALTLLRERKLAGEFHGSGSRVTKYTHRMPEVFNFGRREMALLDVLMLRGPQTLGELRDRSERLHKFTDLEEVESCLLGLSDRGFVMRLPRQPGFKEARYAHLLSGEPILPESASAAPAPSEAPGLSQRVAALEEEIREIRRQWEDFRRQFE